MGPSHEAAATDDVDMVLSYDRVTEAIDAVLAEERLNLLETLAERVAERILAEPRAERVFVRIEKIDRGPFALGVEIVRSREGERTPATELHDTPHPRIVHLSNAALASDGLSDLLDRLTDVPVILTVGPAAAPAPQSAAPQAQWRIDLLAIEQNAWVLASRSMRHCIVVGSRTELDWALRHGQVSVWAPSKIVLDAVEGPPHGTGNGDPLALVAWFAGLLGASELVVVGDSAPAATVPTREEPLP